MKKRDQYLDIVKGIAIFLVVFGHCMQYGSGVYFEQGHDLFSNYIFKFIYTFHMPLFMIVSGYLFAFSVQRHSFKELFVSRFTTLLVPILVWTLITCPLSGDVKANILQYFRACVDSLWFLWAIFYCSLIVLLVRHFFKDNVWIYVAGFVGTFLIPDKLNMQLYKYMYPFFVCAYLFHRSGKNLDKLKNWKGVAFVSALFVVVYMLFENDTYIYMSAYCIWGKSIPTQIWNNLLRMAAGFVGSIWLLLIVRMVMERIKITWLKKLLSELGKYSLGIYILSGDFMQRFVIKMTSQFTLNYGITFVESVVLIAICLGITWVISRVKLLTQTSHPKFGHNA